MPACVSLKILDSHSRNGNTVHVNDEVFFFTDNIFKSDPNAEKKEKSSDKPNSKESLDEKSPGTNSTTKAELSPCESKERSLDCPRSKLTGEKFDAIIGRSYGLRHYTSNKKYYNCKSLVKIQVENCWKNDDPEPSDDVAVKDKTSDTRGPEQNSIDTVKSGSNRKCTEDHHQQQAPTTGKKSASEGKNKFTWCGSCKGSKIMVVPTGQGSKTAAAAAAAVAAKSSKRTSSTSPSKKSTRSTLSADAADSNKINLNMSKFSPCASRLAASSKILSSDSLGATSPESPLHVGRARSPVQASLSLNVHQRPNSGSRGSRPARSKSVSGADSCVTSPTSEATNLSCSPPGTEILSLEDVSASGKQQQQQVGEEQPTPRAVAPASAIELSLDRDRRANSNYRSPR